MEKNWDENDFKPAQPMSKSEMSGWDICTVGELKKFISDHNMPDDAKIVVQRVFDWYYEKGSWKSYKKLQDGHEQEYHPAWCAVFYPDDPDILFIDLHY